MDRLPGLVFLSRVLSSQVEWLIALMHSTIRVEQKALAYTSHGRWTWLARWHHILGTWAAGSEHDPWHNAHSVARDLLLMRHEGAAAGCSATTSSDPALTLYCVGGVASTADATTIFTHLPGDNIQWILCTLRIRDTQGKRVNGLHFTWYSNTIGLAELHADGR